MTRIFEPYFSYRGDIYDGLLSSGGSGGAAGLPAGAGGRRDLPGGGHRAPYPADLRRGVRGVRHPQQPDRQLRGHQRQTPDHYEAHRLPRQRSGGAGAAERSQPPHLPGEANGGGSLGVAAADHGPVPGVPPRRGVSGQLSGRAWLRAGVRRLPTGLPVGRADGHDHRLCEPLSGSLRGQSLLQHHPRLVPDGGAGLCSGGAGLAG